MSTASPTPQPVASLDDCPLPVAAQHWNIFCFASFWAIYYLVAPVTYIGSTHALLLEGLKYEETVSNLPSACYQWGSVFPILVAWLFPSARWLRLLILATTLSMAAITLAVALALAGDTSGATAGIIVAHGAVFGIANGTLVTALWDSVRRGISTSRRGLLLGITFGVGPLFACVGALGQDALFDGQLLGGNTFDLEFPVNYRVMFMTVAPLLLLAGIVMALFRVPATAGEGTVQESPRNLLKEGLEQVRNNPVLLYTVVLYVIVYSGGNAIFANASLYTKEVLGEDSETLGMQGFLRFGAKAIAGALLGWLLAKASPRATLLATTGILVFALSWMLSVTGWWYMATFGLLGAGELFGAYFPNYITTASAKPYVRLNMAFMGLVTTLVGFASLAFGLIAEHYGLRASFYVAGSMVVLAMALIVALLPATPRPDEESLKSSV